MPRPTLRDRAPWRTLSAALLATVTAAPSLATDPPAFFAPVEVPLVNVEVFVSDRDGRPVPGLTADDFEVREDGEVVELSHFWAAPGVAAPHQTETGEPTSEATAQTAADVEAQRLFLVVLVDDTNLGRGRRQSTLDHLRGFLERDLPADLQMMLVSYDGGLRILHPFTAEPQTLVTSLSQLEGRVSSARSYEQERILRDLQRASGETDPDLRSQEAARMEAEIRSYANQTRQLLLAAFADFTALARSLSALPGRKAILLVGDGIEQRPGQLLFAAYEQAFNQGPGAGGGSRALIEANRFDVGRELRQLIETSNAYRVSFYTLSTLVDSGLATVSAANRGFAFDGGADVGQALANEQATSTLAARTGGRSLANNQALPERLDEVAVELGSVYSLAYVPGHLGDGGYHKLKVAVRRDDVVVRHRDGYLDTPPSDRLADRTLAAARLGVDDNPLGIRLEEMRQTPREDGSVVVSVMVRIPIGSLVLVPEGAVHRGQLAIVLTAADNEGRLAPVSERSYPVEIATDELAAAAANEAGYVLGLAMRTGPHRVAVGVRDELARVESTVGLDVTVGSDAE